MSVRHFRPRTACGILRRHRVRVRSPAFPLQFPVMAVHRLTARKQTGAARTGRAVVGLSALPFRRRHRWSTSLALSSIALFSLVVAFCVPASSSPARNRSPYSIGSSIRALKLTRLQMLTSKVGVGVAPITTYAGALVRAYLVRTGDAGSTWHVTGIFPKGFYPWTTAFTTPVQGYVINSTGAHFTKNGGRSWSRVETSGAPLSISVKDRAIWIPVENCVTSAMQGPCSTHLDAYSEGELVPKSVTSLPTNQPELVEIGPTSGYSFEISAFRGDVLFTSNSGATWHAVANPCQRHQISYGVVTSVKRLSLFCGMSTNGAPGPTVFFRSQNGGISWSKVSAVPNVGAGDDVGSAGPFLWVLTPTLWESSDGGRDWSVVSNVIYGPSGNIATYGNSEAWHVVPGHGIYRTLDGETWTLIK